MIFKTYKGEELEEGKRYRWYASVDDFAFKNMKCKIMKSELNKVYIYDYETNSEYEYTNNNLEYINAFFKRMVG